MPETIRSFIAIELNEAIRSALANTQCRLKKLDCYIKWVNPENMHITLKFLGNIEIKTLNAIKEIIKKTTSNTCTIPFELTQIGIFPNTESPRIIWSGINEPAGMLKVQSDSLNEKLAELGIPKEKKEFNPHITIGRVKSNKNIRKFIKILKEPLITPGIKQSASHITLFKSTLTPMGARYEVLTKIKISPIYLTNKYI